MSARDTLRRFHRFLFIFSFFTIVVLAIPVAMLLHTHTKAFAAWYNDNWSYRVKITVTNTSNTTNQTISLGNFKTNSLITAGKMQSDCGDSVWTDADGKILQYLIASGCNSSNTTYTVIVPAINNGTTVLYIYYGNPAAQNMFQTTLNAAVCSGCTVAEGSEETGPGPVLWMSFDEMRENSCPDGSDFCDKSSHGNNASLEASAVEKWDVPEMCVFDNCITLHGGPDAASIADNNSLDFGTGSFTVQAWVRDTSAADSDYIFAKEDAVTSGSYDLRLAGGGKFGFRISDNATAGKDTVETDGTYNYHDMRWHHVAGVKDGTSRLLLYIDGKLTAWKNTISSTGSLSNSLSAYVAELGNATGYWNGSLDELKIFPYARTANEIAADYTGGASVHGLSSTVGSPLNTLDLSDGLVSWWRLDESGTNAPQDSGERGLTLSRLNSPVMTSGKYGNGADLENSSEMYFSRADAVATSITGSLSVAAWIKPESNTAATQYDIACKWVSTNQSYCFAQYGDELRMYIDDAANYVETTQANLATGNWYFVVGAYDASTQNVTIFVNGVQQSTAATGTIPASIADDTSAFMVGAQDYDGATAGSATNTYDGIIDEVRLYETALSQETVTALYNYAPGPISRYTFDENSGLTAYDTSGNGNNATLANAASFAPGMLGAALKGDGVSGYANLGSPSLTDNMTQFTVSAWILNRGTVSGRIIDKQNSSNAAGWKVSLATDGLFTFTVDYDTTDLVVEPDNMIPANTWTHFELSWDGSPNATGVQAYINGVQQNTWNTQQNGTTTRADDSAQSIGIGCRVATSNQCLNAKFDDVHIYNYVRSPAEVVEDMNGGHPAPGSPAGSYAGYWKFDEMYGTTAHDASYNRIDLTLADATDWSPDGKFGGAFIAGRGSRDASVSNVTQQDYYDFSATQSFTVSAWAKSTDAANPASAEAVIGKSDVTPGYALYFDTSGHACFGITDNTTWPNVSACSAGDFYDAAWHHILGVRDTVTDQLYIYVDGMTKSSISDTTTGTLDNAQDLRIGQRTNTNDGDEFQGLIDEVKIYAIALTSDQVKLEYNRGADMTLGSISTASNGFTATNSASADFCVPGDSASCSPPVAWWKMEEGSGTTLTDYSINNNNGTIADGVKWTTGRYGPGLKFADGIQRTNVQVPDTALWNFTDGQSFTIEGWFTRSAAISQDTVISHRSTTSSTCTGNPGWIMWLGTTTPDINFRMCDTGGDVYSMDSNTTFSDGSGWHQFAIVWDDASEARTAIYVDGAHDYGTPVGTFANIGDTTASFPLCIGTQANNSTACITAADSTAHQGVLDDFRIFNYARTPAQVAWDYNRGEAKFWYKFDDCQGNTVHNGARTSDGSAPGLDGTIVIGSTGTQNKTGSCTGNSTDAWFNGATGKRNASLNLDGTDDSIDFGDQHEFEYRDGRDFSIAFWIKPTLNATGTVLAKKNSTGAGTAGYLFTTAANGTLDLYLSDATNQYQLTKANAATANTWTHVVAVVDEDSVTNTDLYINAVKGNALQTGTLTSVGNIAVNTANLTVGSESDAQNFWAGQIDGLRIYQYALNPVQIKNIYNDAAGVRFGPDTGSP